MSYDFSAAFGLISQTTKITTLKYTKIDELCKFGRPTKMHIIKTTFLPLRLPSALDNRITKEVEKL